MPADPGVADGGRFNAFEGHVSVVAHGDRDFRVKATQRRSSAVLASLPDPPAPTPSRARRLEGALRQVVRLPAGPIDAALRGHAAMIVRSGFAVHRLTLGPMSSTELLGPGDVVFGGTLDDAASLPAHTAIEAIQPVEITLLGAQLSDAIARDPNLGVTCLDCHVNGHTTGQFHLTPDMRPQERRFRLDTTSLRGVFDQQIHGSKRSLRSVEDFTEFEQRTAYFNGDEVHAIKKGMNILDRIQVSHMAQMQNMFDFPPAPKLNPATSRLDSSKASPSELRGEQIFSGKGQCSSCHAAPFYLDHQMHDLHVERFLKDEPGDGPIKTFTLRGIKESPPYLHDGRCLTLEDTVEFFNLVLQTKLTSQEKVDLVAFMRTL